MNAVSKSVAATASDGRCRSNSNAPVCVTEPLTAGSAGDGVISAIGANGLQLPLGNVSGAIFQVGHASRRQCVMDCPDQDYRKKRARCTREKRFVACRRTCAGKARVCELGRVSPSHFFGFGNPKRCHAGRWDEKHSCRPRRLREETEVRKQPAKSRRTTHCRSRNAAR